MDLKVFFEVVVPLLEMEKAVLIMISTPVDSFNFYSRLLGLKNSTTGDDLFLVYEVDLVCDRCKLTSKEPTKCRHMLKYLPSWKSADKLEIVAMMYGDRKTTLLRESMGVITDASGGYFLSRDIDAMFNAEPWQPEPTSRPDYVLITCDPNAKDTETSSEMSLVALVPQGRGYAVSAKVFFCISFLLQSSKHPGGGIGRPHQLTYEKRMVRTKF
jgi:hypothetical protein